MRLFFAFVLAFPLAALANSTYYTSFSPDYFHTSPAQACKPAVDSITLQDGVQIVEYLGDPGGTCAYRYSYNGGAPQVNGLTIDGAPVYVRSKQCIAGDTSEVSFPIGRELRSEGDSSFQSFGNVAPSTLCVAGCQGAKSSSQSSDLFALPDPQSELHDLIYANVSYDLDGAACATADNPPDFEIPPPDAQEPDPCAADPNAPGCTDPTDPTDPTNPTDPTDPTDPGGGGNTGGGDTGGGDTGGGDTGGGDTGGGDSGADTGSVAGLPCDTTLACSGDAIQCAMLQTQKEQKCLNESLWDWNSQKGDVESYVAAQSEGPDFDEGEGDVDVSGLFGDAINTRFFPSACPPAESVSLNTAGGRTFEFTYEPLCQLASDFSYLIVLAASIFFAVYVGRSMGGE